MSNVAKKIIKQLDEKDKTDVYNWAKTAKVIVNDEKLSSLSKVQEIYKLNKKYKSLATFFRVFIKQTKIHVWENRGCGLRPSR